MHVLLVLLEVELLCFLKTHLHSLLGEIFDERFGFRQTFVGTEERQLTFLTLFVVRGIHFLLRLHQEVRRQGRLLAYERSHAILVLIEHLILALGDRTGDDQRCTGIIDQDGVDLIDDGVVMSTLYEVKRRGSHVITQVVKTKLIIRSERNITSIGLTALVAIRTMLVNTVHRQAEEHINRSVPLGVTFSEVIVDGNHVYTFVGQGIEVYRQGSHEGLTFTGSHLGNLTLMQHNTTEELHVIVDHVPMNLITPCHPVVFIDSYWLLAIGCWLFYFHEVETRISSQVFIHLGCSHLNGLVFGETACGRFDDRVRLGKNFREDLLILIFYLFFEFIYFVVYLLTFLDRRGLNLRFEI